MEERTVNPWNKNPDGSVKTQGDVWRDAVSAAEEEAKKLQGSTVTCNDCLDLPNRTLLLEMAAQPDAAFPEPDCYYDSPMSVLADRAQVERVMEKCNCGSDCCSGWKHKSGFKITAKGLKRARQLQA